MDRVVCQVKADAGQMMFTWSADAGAFSPYVFKVVISPGYRSAVVRAESA
jgi:hypothetical protein